MAVFLFVYKEMVTRMKKLLIWMLPRLWSAAFANSTILTEILMVSSNIINFYVDLTMHIPTWLIKRHVYQGQFLANEG